MIHPNTELRFINETKGYGVVATAFIPKGTITWALDKLDRIFRPSEIEALGQPYIDILDRYSYRNAEGNHILCWDIARYVNHSSLSNCITTAYEFEIAIRDIHPGEELTDDYGYLNLDEPFEVLPESGTDRTTIYPDDLLRYYHLWDNHLLDAFPSIPLHDQPLMQVLPAETQKRIQDILTGKRPLDSILACYCGKNPGRINGEAKLIQTRSPHIAYPF